MSKLNRFGFTLYILLMVIILAPAKTVPKKTPVIKPHAPVATPTPTPAPTPTPQPQFLYLPTLARVATLQWHFDANSTQLQSFIIWIGDSPDTLHPIPLPLSPAPQETEWEQKVLVNTDHEFFKVTATGIMDPPQNVVARILKSVPMSITSPVSIILHPIVAAQAVTSSDSYSVDSEVIEYDRPTPTPYPNPCYQTDCQPTPIPNANNSSPRTIISTAGKVRSQP